MRPIIITLYSSLIVIYTVSRFWDNLFFSYAVGILAVLSLAAASFYASGLYKKSGLAFLILASILFVYNGTAWSSFFLYFDSMIGILSLFFVLPFLNSIIRAGQYDTSLRRLLQNGVHDLHTLYTRSFLISHFLGLFLNIATVSLVHRTLKPSLSGMKTKMADIFYTRSILRGYALCLVWSPIEIMVIISLDLTGYSYINVVPFLIPLVLLMFFSDWIFSRRQYKDLPLVMENSGSIPLKKILRKTAQMMGMLCVLVLTATLFEYLFEKGFLFSVVISIVPIAFIWALLINRRRRYLNIAVPVFKERTFFLSNYFFMFLSAGFFVEMLSASPFIAYLEAVFLTNTEHELLLFGLIGLYFILASFSGFHPLVSIALLGEVLSPVLADISSISLALVLITSSLATAIYSPYNLSVSLLAGQMNLVPFQLSFWNLPFSLYFIGSSILIAYGLTFIL
ncbi:hypothetical protein ATL39_0855 [Sinobaca qinghaiensis]|uniref:Uncharacterized protein n=1 Tax=Sinobaca qinghaiensis TaxID=342944 RepID=A0A419V5C8_9BACL|nr:hypothetical protein [Sinobaca qinghaiensis]RKD75158.1 hypothetical protein ATL39_0855 [Sinobaca qinghaiensis]